MSDSADRLKSPVSTGDVVGGKYRVEKVLGAGGMGVVLAATHVDLDQKVALKFILPQALTGKGNVERFLREARAVVKLKSEHVAKVFDVGREMIGDEERPYMVLELLEGMDLAKLNKQKGPLPVADAVEYVLQACEALVEAHALGIVHRDLKPQNLFVTRRLNGTPLVKVLDFGIAKAVGPNAEGQMSLTDSAAVIGSPLYMAPEQMRSARSAEIRSDVWALGVILYELLGGQLPFDGETVTEVCIRVVNEPPPELIKLRPGLDEKLVGIVMRCLEKDVNARFHNVASLATALEPFSRSAQQGGLVRPWRSFEDTMDSHEARSPQGLGLNTPADATGPATAVTMDSLSPEALEALSEEERRARAGAGSTKASAGVRPSNAPEGEKHPLVSTDVTWGDSTGKQPKKTRTFATGLAAGAFVSLLAAAGIVGVLLGRSAGSAPKSNASGGEPPAAAASAAAPTTASAPATAPASATAMAATTATDDPKAGEAKPAAKPSHPAHPLPGMGTATGPAGRILGAKGTAAAARTSETAGAAPPPSATVSHPPETKSEPAAPNGAPILR